MTKKNMREKICELNMCDQKIKALAVMTSLQARIKSFLEDINGKVGVPILLYFLGVPGILVILLWAFFFRGE